MRLDFLKEVSNAPASPNILQVLQPPVLSDLGDGNVQTANGASGWQGQRLEPVARPAELWGIPDPFRPTADFVRTPVDKKLVAKCGTGAKYCWKLGLRLSLNVCGRLCVDCHLANARPELVGEVEEAEDLFRRVSIDR